MLVYYNSMNRFILVVAAFLFSAGAFAQEIDTLSNNNSVMVYRDTLTYTEILSEIEYILKTPTQLAPAMDIYIQQNPSRQINGFRLRIFFDNKQDARVVSEQIVEEFKLDYPTIPVYRSYKNPYFKVTVGDFRAKSEALKFLKEIKLKYPAAFIVREAFSTI